MIHGTSDTARAPWPLAVHRYSRPPVAVRLDDDPQHLGNTDRLTIGRAFPTGTYVWFLPTGTRALADERLNDQLRLRLARDVVAWIPLADAHPAAARTDLRRAMMGSLTLHADSAGRVRLRIPLSRAVAQQVDADSTAMRITLYDVVSDANFTRYGGARQRLVSRLDWTQATADQVVLTVQFAQMLWGWRDWIDGNDLIFEFRGPPPPIRPDRPLAGRRIVIDPGHPPEGACGPTGLCEPEANLAVAERVRDGLAAAGAEVVLTRTGPEPVDLWPRVALADSLDADLLVSIHQNALPQGLNPFVNSGTSTFFNHAQSQGLARAVQRRLVASLGLRDLGVVRGDLALVRPTWYPSILTEGMFLMMPDQEMALRTTAGQARYADGVVQGITDFLRAVTRRPAPRR